MFQGGARDEGREGGSESAAKRVEDVFGLVHLGAAGVREGEKG